ncbi:DNA-processing protein DprA [Clostridium polynesiense]|uniref:DNA-processing protein DprA n=1 Tax=Clostridium polynesiense TaxID=1325933 RepID=UPI00058C18AA|nr:DNA-processing protein DprA [Clostridium polynesiense]
MELCELWLGTCPIRNYDKILLLEKFQSSEMLLSNILSNKKDIEIKKEIREKLSEAWNKEKLEDYLLYLKKSNIKFITAENPDYNTNLYNTGLNRPYILYYKGNINKLQKFTAAVVGSRNCTDYGREICMSIVKELVRLGINVISGGALGIDSIAHRSCLSYDGFTGAVLGSGIDVLYPYVNKSMFKEISEKGVLLSEYIPETKPHNYNFPNRNRIISGISDIVIIVEAKENSGSCITARHGAEQGRDIIAVPGALSMKNSTGCNMLIQSGANIYLGYESIHTILEFNHKWINQQESSPVAIQNNSIKETVFSIISDKPTHIDEIQKHTNVDISLLYELLFEMQLNKEIISLSGNFYARLI